MNWAKDVIRKFQGSVENEAVARGRAVRQSFTFARPRNGWFRWFLWKLLMLTLLALRGWVYIVLLFVLVAWLMYDQEPTDLIRNWSLMRGK